MQSRRRRVEGAPQRFTEAARGSLGANDGSRDV